ncbi:succinate dehydrogenase, cytochrome b556 subunit [Gammaproteobacteria bacterium]|jgi:succinate dehydrogenase / fumarate reductase cytochrome b subunit|nr:succinate dehydrogenase, cytochrome b556 subunit [Gammaproteobacteria bacterium]|tara:strand:- start:455 stop:838 length:384 start_codon:yes stop_codon:yes gene_type:complete
MDQRPVYIDLTKIKLPMSAFSSITHRLSGMYIFFITIPVSLFIFNHSTASEKSFNLLVESINNISFFSVFTIFSFLVLWYHILTGIRHLFMDFFHIGESLSGSYYSSIFALILWLLSSVAIFYGVYS